MKYSIFTALSAFLGAAVANADLNCTINSDNVINQTVQVAVPSPPPAPDAIQTTSVVLFPKSATQKESIILKLYEGYTGGVHFWVDAGTQETETYKFYYSGWMDSASTSGGFVLVSPFRLEVSCLKSAPPSL